MAKPHIVVLGSNFAGLGVAQELRQKTQDNTDITVIDRKPYLLFVPNIGIEVLENRNPLYSMQMPLLPAMQEDNLNFILGDVHSIDVERQVVEFMPTERLGSAVAQVHYDYLVVALGARLAYDQIEGFAEFGHTVSDTYYGNQLRRYLYGQYQGGPVAVGSAHFHQGSYSTQYVPSADAGCEGPPIEVMLSMGNWLKSHHYGGPENVSVFTPAEWIAEDAGMGIVHGLLKIAGDMGYHYVNKTGDIKRLTKDGIEFIHGPSIEAELKIIFPDWVAHPFLHDLPISDDVGFIETDMTMRNPKYSNVFACGDAAAVTVPKLGILAHREAEVVAQQISHDLGLIRLGTDEGKFIPIVDCIGDMGANEAFYISSNTWYGGDREIFRMGRIPFLLKLQYKNMFFRTNGKVPPWGLPAADLFAELLGRSVP